MSSSNPPTLAYPVQPTVEDEIDLRQVTAALFRQKKLIVGVVSSALLLSCLYAFTRERVWQGEFQIVLETQGSGSGGRLVALAAAPTVTAASLPTAQTSPA